MKKFYGSIVTGLALLTIATPIANTTIVKAAENDNTNAITQSGNDGELALNAQLQRVQDESNSGKYNPAQIKTLTNMSLDLYDQEDRSSDNQKMVMAQNLKDYLDKGIVGYTVDAWGSSDPVNVNDDNDYVSPKYYTYFTFKGINEPEVQKLDFPGYTVVDKNGTPSDGRVKMWLDDNYELHVDSNYTKNVYGDEEVMVVRNGEKANISNTITAPIEFSTTVTTTRLARLYKLNGDLITNRMLGANTAWYSDKYTTINGERMYRVATDEWVRATDII